MEVCCLIASLRKKLCYLHLIYVRVPTLTVQIVMFDPVSHKQRGPEARHDHPSCISWNKRSRVTAWDRPKNATPPWLWLLLRQYLQLHWNMFVSKIPDYMSTMMSTFRGGLFKLLGFLEVKDSRNCNNQNGSNNNTLTIILPIFPAMLFDTKGLKNIAPAKSKITVKAFCGCLLYLLAPK